jgi:hypothetical protein
MCFLRLAHPERFLLPRYLTPLPASDVAFPALNLSPGFCRPIVGSPILAAAALSRRLRRPEKLGPSRHA